MMFPCPLCGRSREVKRTKKRKPYLIVIPVASRGSSGYFTRHSPLPGKTRSASQLSQQISTRLPDRTDPRRGGWQRRRHRGADHS